MESFSSFLGDGRKRELHGGAELSFTCASGY